MFSKESLETLKQRIDLVEVLSSHLDLKRSGASYKGLCPFHDEKSPSFMIQKGDSHYHCFGCGAHGDAIQFLMSYLKMSFVDAVESLAQRFNVHLEREESTEKKGPNKAALKTALDMACNFYQFNLLHTAEGHKALDYLYQRGIDLDFIHRFRIGLASKESGMLRKLMHAKFIKDETLIDAGLISSKDGRYREFFQDRITFPICDATGAVIGFSARKYKDETFGGKYINTSETPLFKKSRILFGLHHSRRRIAKERKAIIVEGQIDALRLIAAGFNITVAGQGTAFGEGHVKELVSLGLNEVYLALDSDEAGIQATCKIGDFFQREGVEARVVEMPKGSDPDSFLRENGPAAFLELMNGASDYLSFLVKVHSRKVDLNSPAGKNELVQAMVHQIRAWEHPVMVHESLRKLAYLMKVPESLIGVGEGHVTNIFIKKSVNIGIQTIDPDRILESDFLRWLLPMGPQQQRSSFIEIAKHNVKVEDLHVNLCRQLYQACLDCSSSPQSYDLLSIIGRMEDQEGQILLQEILDKKINEEKAEEHLCETIQRILDRNWMEKREEIKSLIHNAQCSDEEALQLVKKFDELKRSPPKLIRQTGQTGQTGKFAHSQSV